MEQENALIQCGGICRYTASKHACTLELCNILKAIIF